MVLPATFSLAVEVAFNSNKRLTLHLTLCFYPSHSCTHTRTHAHWPYFPSQKKVMGSVVGGRKDMNEMLEFAAMADIKPMCETMPLSKVNEAITRMKDNKVNKKQERQCCAG